MWQSQRSAARRQLPARYFILVVLVVLAGVAAQSPDVDTAAITPDSIAVLCSLEDSFAVIADKARPGVVSITAVHTSPTNSRTSAHRPDFGEGAQSEQPQITPVQSPDSLPEFSVKVTATGSGVIVKRDGGTFYVLTNQHVIGNAVRVKVHLFDETELKGRVVGIDPVTDLAVVSLSSSKLSDKNVVAMGDSGDVRVGAWAIALGSPLGFQETMTVGVISALKRQLEDEETFYTDLIQTDAAINPGNSGGPLLDVEGRVIGINTAIASPTGGSVGLGFAIPINVAKSILDTLIRDGRVIRGWLGVGIQDLTPPLEEYYGTNAGVLVASVNPTGPGRKAGLQEEDIVISIDGLPVKDIFQMQSVIAGTKPGTMMKLSVLRGNRQLDVSAVTGQSPTTPAPLPPESEVAPRKTLGIKVKTLTEELARRVGLKSTDGVIVVDVATGGIAEEAGLEVGDVITRMNGQQVGSDKEFAALVERIPAGGVMAWRVMSDGSAKILGLKKE